MDPTNYAHYNHNEKGMIFLRIGRGELSNLESMGKSHVSTAKPLSLSTTLFVFLTFPCLIQLPP